LVVFLGLAAFLVLLTTSVGLLFIALAGSEYVLSRLRLGRATSFALIMIKNLRRNPLRSILTYLAVFVLVSVLVMVWSALWVLDNFMQGKANDIKVVVSEKYQGASQMPWSYAVPLCEGAYDRSRPDSQRPQDSMTWQFYITTIDPVKLTRDSQIFFFVMDPQKAPTLMERLFDDVPQQSKQKAGIKLGDAQEFMSAINRMVSNKRGVIIGSRILTAIGKRVGDRIKVFGINYKDIDLEVEIVGSFPEGRFSSNAILNRDYFNDALDNYPRTHGGEKHAHADRRLNMVILQVEDLKQYSKITEQIDSSGQFVDPAVKCETLSAYAVTRLDSYRDIIFGMRWLLAPAIVVTLALIIANAISLSVRERRKEVAIFKVLGYQPGMILVLILGEAMLLGALGGLLGSVVLYQAVNRLVDSSGTVLPIFIPEQALWWGPVMGLLAGFAGSVVPAWNACRTRVATVFARVG
jgi:putative ABC transport system permease protein